MNEHAKWSAEKRCSMAAEALRKHGFGAEVFSTREAVVERVLADAAEAQTVGFGGSATVVELGLPIALAERGKECLIHGAAGLELSERVEIMRRQLTCDLFLTGSNAVTLDGQLVNIDATGNRVGALAFGPRRVRVIAGANKLTEDVHDAVRRIKAWTAPPNAHRLSFDTPCATTGKCVDCASPNRICRIVHILERCPRLTDLSVYLVPEPLGF